MAKKGESKGEKRLAASKAVSLSRKEKAWTVRAKPGPHSRKSSVALGLVLRDMVGIARTMKEAKRLLNGKMVLVDGRVVNDPRLPVGLFDLVEVVPEKKAYRLLFDRKGRLVAREEKPGKREKLCKVVSKRAVGKGRTQLQTNDGRTLLQEKSSVKVADSLLLQVPGQKVLNHFKLGPGFAALVVSGRNVGTVGTIKKITPGTMRRPKLVTLDAAGKELQTTEANVFVVGEKKPALEVKGE